MLKIKFHKDKQVWLTSKQNKSLTNSAFVFSGVVWYLRIGALNIY